MDNKTDSQETKAVEPVSATTAETGPVEKPGNVATTVAVVDPEPDTADKAGDVAKTATETGNPENPPAASGIPEVREPEGATTTNAKHARVEEEEEESAIGPALPPGVDAMGTRLEELPPYLANNIPLRQLFEALPNIVAKVGYNEMWGIHLKNSKDVPTVNTLIKFLRANDGDIDEAITQLHKALYWRKLNNPLGLMKKAFSEDKFKDLGFVTMYDGPAGSGKRVVVTWNLYGATKDVKTTFADTNEFLLWRAALMEMAIRELKMDEATTVIDYDGEDPYQMIQVHDYKNVSFLRLDSGVKKASTGTIKTFGTVYPELLSKKYFVNVPWFMGWVYGLIKSFIAPKTLQKLNTISNGAELAKDFGEYGYNLPPVYGGKGYVLDAQGVAPRLVPNERLGEPEVNIRDLRDFSQDSEAGPSGTHGDSRASEEKTAAPAN